MHGGYPNCGDAGSRFPQPVRVTGCVKLLELGAGRQQKAFRGPDPDEVYAGHGLGLGWARLGAKR